MSSGWGRELGADGELPWLGDNEIDLTRRRVTRRGVAQRLTGTEVKLLQYLARRTPLALVTTNRGSPAQNQWRPRGRARHDTRAR